MPRNVTLSRAPWPFLGLLTLSLFSCGPNPTEVVSASQSIDPHLDERSADVGAGFGFRLGDPEPLPMGLAFEPSLWSSDAPPPAFIESEFELHRESFLRSCEPLFKKHNFKPSRREDSISLCWGMHPKVAAARRLAADAFAHLLRYYRTFQPAQDGKPSSYDNEAILRFGEAQLQFQQQLGSISFASSRFLETHSRAASGTGLLGFLVAQDVSSSFVPGLQSDWAPLSIPAMAVIGVAGGGALLTRLAMVASPSWWAAQFTRNGLKQLALRGSAVLLFEAASYGLTGDWLVGWTLWSAQEIRDKLKAMSDLDTLNERAFRNPTEQEYQRALDLIRERWSHHPFEADFRAHALAVQFHTEKMRYHAWQAYQLLHREKDPLDPQNARDHYPFHAQMGARAELFAAMFRDDANGRQQASALLGYFQARRFQRLVEEHPPTFRYQEFFLEAAKQANLVQTTTLEADTFYSRWQHKMRPEFRKAFEQPVSFIRSEADRFRKQRAAAEIDKDFLAPASQD